MYKLIHPIIKLASENLLAVSRFLCTPAEDQPAQGLLLWQHSLENQASFIREYTDGLLALMAQNRLLLHGHCEKLSKRQAHVAAQLTHTAVRAVAIATHARREKRDRRVLPVPLASERRGESRADRRLLHAGSGYHAVI